MTEHSESMPGPQPIPAAFQQNGHTPSQIALSLMQQMPQMLAQAFASVLQQVPVRTAGQFRCTGCIMNRLAWVAAHQRDADAANEAFMQAVMAQSELPPDDPRRQVPPDFVMFLPEALRPGAHPQGMPPIQDGTVMMSGAVFCVEHVPGAPGKPQLLVAQGGLSPAMLAGLAA
jgi:hypothetical protein